MSSSKAMPKYRLSNIRLQRTAYAVAELKSYVLI